MKKATILRKKKERLEKRKERVYLELIEKYRSAAEFKLYTCFQNQEVKTYDEILKENFKPLFNFRQPEPVFHSKFGGVVMYPPRCMIITEFNFLSYFP